MTINFRLFTKKFIAKGELITEYKGTITTWSKVNHDEGKNGYIYFVRKNFVIDASQHPKELARYANDAKGLTKLKGFVNNAEYYEEGTRVFILAKKDIEAGSEIFVDYGKEYWDVIKYNMKIDKDKAKKTK